MKIENGFKDGKTFLKNATLTISFNFVKSVAAVWCGYGMIIAPLFKLPSFNLYESIGIVILVEFIVDKIHGMWK